MVKINSTMMDLFLDWFDPNSGAPFTFLNGTFWLFLWGVIIGLSILSRLERRIQARNAFLFAVSLFFYWKTSGWFVALLIFSTSCDWLIGAHIGKSTGHAKRRWLALSLAINLGVLLYFKYAYFIADCHAAAVGCALVATARCARTMGEFTFRHHVSGGSNSAARRNIVLHVSNHVLCHRRVPRAC